MSDSFLNYSDDYNNYNINYNNYLAISRSNIPGNDVSKGTVVCDYMRPVVPKGAGYHRFAFVLYKHMNGKLDLSEEQRKPNTYVEPSLEKNILIQNFDIFSQII